VSDSLFKIPLSLWVVGTIEKMNKHKKSDFLSWSEYWYETYKELGGKSQESGKKLCPQHAAYGLWRLGRIRGTTIPYQNKPFSYINSEYGKNALYALLALDILGKRKSPIEKADLWVQVQEQFRKIAQDEPAMSQQGVVTVAFGLFKEGFIVSGRE
jgi:hypothetical protein